MIKKEYKVISLFSCIGGSDLGFIGGFEYLGKRYPELPAEIVFASDIDAKAVATYNANFEVKAEVGDIRKIDTARIPDGNIIIGGFPCQSFSTVNPTKNPFDERGQLYMEMSRVLRDKKPIAFVAENVKGMARLKGGSILSAIIDEFSRQGYNIAWTIINAADFGVPQRRERVFIVGIRKDLNKFFKFPEGTHSEDGKDSKKKWVGLGSVIDNIRGVDKKYYFSDKAVEGMKNAKNNMKRGLAQDLDSPSLTITSHLAKVSINSRDPVLLVDKKRELYRRFTPREAARIQSFPDTFKFVGSESANYAQIGNAIAPVVMWHIAKGLIEQLSV